MCGTSGICDISPQLLLLVMFAWLVLAPVTVKVWWKCTFNVEATGGPHCAPMTGMTQKQLSFVNSWDTSLERASTIGMHEFRIVPSVIISNNWNYVSVLITQVLPNTL